MSDAPACSIDYERDFSLPFALPLELAAAAGLQSYVTALGLEIGVRKYTGMTAASPTEDPTEPSSPEARRAQVVGAAKSPLFPPPSSLPAALAPSRVTVTKAQLDVVGRTLWKAAVPAAGKTTAAVAASTFRWDADARKAFAVPFPTVREDSLVAFWNADPSGGPTVGSQEDGVFDDQAADYLLTTGTQEQDGEIDGLLVRAPARCLLRFERYRHLLRAPAGALEVSHPSTTGAVLMRMLPTTLAPPEAGAPLFKHRTLVLEGVDVDAASSCFGALAFCELLHRDDVRKIGGARDPHAAQLVWQFRSWLAYLQVVRPLARPGDPDVTNDIAANVRAPFEKTGTPKAAEIEAFATAILAATSTTDSFSGFLRDFYGPVLCGTSWTELGAEIPSDPATRPANLKFQHEVLERLMQAPDAWLVIFAGAPVGKASAIYGDSAPADFEEAADATSAYELEALLKAGHAADVFTDVTPPAEPDALAAWDLSDYDGKKVGHLCAFRAVDPTAKRSFTGFDWLGETIKGSNRRVAEDAPLDFSGLALASHPLVDPLTWQEFTRAQKLRADLDALDGSTTGGTSLAKATLDWWVNKTGLGVAGNWPTGDPFVPAGESPAGPSTPYASGDTRAISGFDAYDLEAVLVASQFVKDARAPANPPPLAVFLAVLEREGYRAGARADRIGGLEGAPFKDFSNPSASLTEPNFVANGIPDTAATRDALARYDWILFPYGLDIFDQGLALNAGFAASIRAAFANPLTNLQNNGLFSTDLPPLYAHQFALDRLLGRWDPATQRPQNLRLSRRLQVLGIACQQAEYQNRHNLLHTAGGGFVGVNEFTNAAPPVPGPDANSPDRRAFLAYYALVYLAFNVSPPTFNAWVAAADAHRGAEPISTYLLYYQNVAPRVLEPTLPAEPPGSARKLFQRANMLRFAVALDAYLRIGGAAPDTSDPAGRGAW